MPIHCVRLCGGEVSKLCIVWTPPTRLSLRVSGRHRNSAKDADSAVLGDSNFGVDFCALIIRTVSRVSRLAGCGIACDLGSSPWPRGSHDVRTQRYSGVASCGLVVLWLRGAHWCCVAALLRLAGKAGKASKAGWRLAGSSERAGAREGATAALT